MVKKLLLLMLPLVAIAILPARIDAACDGGVILCVTNLTLQPPATPTWGSEGDCELGVAICGVTAIQG